MTDRSPRCLPRSTSARPPTTGLVGRQPRIQRTCGCRRSACGLPDRGRGLRLLDAGCGTGASTAALLSRGPAGRDRGRGRVGGHAGRGAGQALADVGAVRAQPHRGPRRERRRGAVRRHPRRLPDAQSRRSRRPVTEFRRCCAPGATLAVHEYSVRDSPSRDGHVERGVLGHHHPVGPAAHRRRRRSTGTCGAA